MSTGILGSGFGLYGYLPASIDAGEKVVLLERYREKLRGRQDIRSLEDRVIWVRDEKTLLTSCSTLVITRRPVDQVSIANKVATIEGIRYLVLEKPLGSDPTVSLSLFLKLQNHRKLLRFGFIFGYTSWAQDFRSWIAQAINPSKIDIIWYFRAHHYVDGVLNWKRYHREGGGALRFYGIHLIALLSEQGYSSCITSTIIAYNDGEAQSWEAYLTGSGLPCCHLRINTNSDISIFSIAGSCRQSNFNVSIKHPFDQGPDQGGADPRIRHLNTLFRSLRSDDRPVPWYEASLKLWAEIEDRTAWVFCNLQSKS